MLAIVIEWIRQLSNAVIQSVNYVTEAECKKKKKKSDTGEDLCVICTDYISQGLGEPGEPGAYA